MAEVICLGELLIDFVPAAGEAAGSLADAAMFHKAAGGAPANVAVGLARLGVSSAFMGQVGADPFGRFLAATLSGAGVDVSPLRFTSKARTSLAFVSLAAGGEREFLFYRGPGADELFAPDDVDETAIQAAGTLHFGSISLIADPARSATLHAVALARRNGLQVSYDPNLRLALWPSATAAREGMLLGLRHAQVVKIGAEEVEFLTGQPDPIAGMHVLWHDDLAVVAITRGAEGSTWVTRDAHGTVPGFAVTPVDTTGAGDAFMAGLLARLHRRPDAMSDPAGLDQACRLGNAMGAIATTVRGAIPALPDRGAVEAFLRSHGAEMPPGI